MNVAKRHEPSEWLTPQQASDLAEGIASRPTFQRWAEEGKIRAIRLPSGHYRISRSAVIDMLTPVVTPIEGIATKGVDIPTVDPNQRSLLDELGNEQ